MTWGKGILRFTQDDGGFVPRMTNLIRCSQDQEEEESNKESTQFRIFSTFQIRRARRNTSLAFPSVSYYIEQKIF